MSRTSIPSSVSVSAPALPSQSCAAVPSQSDVHPHIIPTWFEGTVRPLYMIHPSVDHITLPISTNEFWNVDFARALFGATISPADFKEFLYISQRFLDAVLWESLRGNSHFYVSFLYSYEL